MKITAIIFIAAVCLCTSSAIADVADDLLNQFKACLDHNPDDAINDAFDNVMAQTTQCWKAAHEAFLHRYPNSPALWHIGSKNHPLPASHTVTDMEAKHLIMIMNGDNACNEILLNYSGQKNSFITEFIRVTKKSWDDENSVMKSYIKGRIALGDLAKKFKHISNVMKMASDKAFSENATVSKTKWEERKRYCNAQLQTNKQNVLEQLDHQEIMRARAQQQVTQQQQQDIEDLRKQNQQQQEEIDFWKYQVQ